jgi:hypothetical protein
MSQVPGDPQQSDEQPLPPGWRNDPYGRYEQRYWDGQSWTQFAATAGVSEIDPMGASPVIPFATQASAFTPPAPPPGPLRGIPFLDSMGDVALERRTPSLRTAVAGLGGVALAVGVLAAVAGNNPSRGRLIIATIAVLAAAVALRLLVKFMEVRAAAVGMAIVAIPGLALSATVSDNRGGFVTGLLLALLFLAAWMAPGFRGTNMLLAAGLLGLLGAFGSLSSTADSQIEKCNQYISDGNFEAFDQECQNLSADSSSNLLPTAVTDSLGDQGVIYLVGAALLLGATWVLDRRGYRGTGTAFAAAGLIASLAGAALLANKFNSTLGPLFVTVVGVLVCIVGSHGARRSTTWWGAALVAGGVVSFVGVQMKPDSNGATGAVGIIAGAVLIFVPAVISAVRRSNGGSDALP